MPEQIWFDIDDTLAPALTTMHNAKIIATAHLPGGDIVDGMATIWTRVNVIEHKGSVSIIFDVLEPGGCTQITIYLPKEQLSNIVECNHVKSKYRYSGVLVLPPRV
jgi:hypothetical protein